MSESLEDFVNISIKTDSDAKKDNSVPPQTYIPPQTVTSSPQKRMLSLYNSGRAFLQRKHRGAPPTENAEVPPKKDPSPQLPRKSSPQSIRKNPSDKDLTSLSSSLRSPSKTSVETRSRSQSDTTSLKVMYTISYFLSGSSEGKNVV